IAGGAREWTWVCEIGEQIADALAATHRLGIIHRDLKPGNVIVSERGDGRPHVFVLDFGIARVSEGLDRLSASDRQPLTRAGAVLGTPGYMSPEQFSGDVVDGRADLYALGVMLWECLAGRRLWTGDTMAVQFTKQLRGELPPLAELAPDTPAPLIELITALLARSPSARPQTAEEVRQRLAELIAVARASGAHPSILTSGAHRVSGPA
ncbi:MAG: serine/threonine protein kinase, partial [Caldilinea sp.]|nr:serine/threonine protein kinase [Caldilinea sp.]